MYWEQLKLFDPALSDVELFNALQFIPDKKRYNVYLQVALIRITGEDIDLALER